jgi:hypothetical protein
VNRVKKLLLAFVLALAALLVVTGCKTGQPPAEQQEQSSESQSAEQGQEKSGEGDLVFISSADKENCEACHRKVSEDRDYSLAAGLEKLEGHPPVGADDGVADCISCHQKDGDISLKKVIHVAHYSGEDNHFVTNYDGSCVHCHKLTDEGQLPVAGLEEPGTYFKTIKVASVDKSPGGCNDCHRKVSDDKDYSLAAEIEKLESHPETPSESVADCASCHAEGTPLALSAIMHTGHLLGENYEKYGNSCINCHDQSNKMLVKGL